MIIGSSGGTTEVIIKIHLMNSFCLSLFSSSRAVVKTLIEVHIERHNYKDNKIKASVCFKLTFSLLKITVLAYF